MLRFEKNSLASSLGSRSVTVAPGGCCCCCTCSCCCCISTNVVSGDGNTVNTTKGGN
ncbi:streptolysin S family bacteriocin [Clostridiaceae bacterium M8S5]|nr:streptolysin S family bacteriocin [Clostridiaceae bacterium M8S5]